MLTYRLSGTTEAPVSDRGGPRNSAPRPFARQRLNQSQNLRSSRRAPKRLCVADLQKRWWAQRSVRSLRIRRLGIRVPPSAQNKSGSDARPFRVLGFRPGPSQTRVRTSDLAATSAAKRLDTSRHQPTPSEQRHGSRVTDSDRPQSTRRGYLRIRRLGIRVHPSALSKPLLSGAEGSGRNCDGQ
jgi:hypothetical protein